MGGVCTKMGKGRNRRSMQGSQPFKEAAAANSQRREEHKANYRELYLEPDPNSPPLSPAMRSPSITSEAFVVTTTSPTSERRPSILTSPRLSVTAAEPPEDGRRRRSSLIATPKYSPMNASSREVSRSDVDVETGSRRRSSMFPTGEESNGTSGHESENASFQFGGSTRIAPVFVTSDDTISQNHSRCGTPQSRSPRASILSLDGGATFGQFSLPGALASHPNTVPDADQTTGDDSPHNPAMCETGVFNEPDSPALPSPGAVSPDTPGSVSLGGSGNPTNGFVMPLPVDDMEFRMSKQRAKKKRKNRYDYCDDSPWGDFGISAPGPSPAKPKLDPPFRNSESPESPSASPGASPPPPNAVTPPENPPLLSENAALAGTAEPEPQE